MLRLERLFKRAYSGDITKILNYSHYRDGLYYFDNGDVGSIVEIDPMPEVVSESILLEVVANLKSFYKTVSLQFPPGSIVQFIIYADPDISPFIDMWGKRKTNPNLKPMIESIARFYRQKMGKPLWEDSSFTFRNFRYFVAFRLPAGMPEYEYRKRLNTFVGALESIQVAGATSNPRIVEPQEFINLMHKILNFKDQKPTVYKENIPLSRQVFRGEIEYKERVLRVSDKYVYTVAAKTPAFASILNISSLMGDILAHDASIRNPFMIVINLGIIDNFKFQSSLRFRLMTTKNTYQVIGKFFPEMIYKIEDMEYTFGQLTQGDKVINYSLNYFIFADSPDEAQSVGNYVVSQLLSAGYDAYKEDFIADMLFLASLPMIYNPGYDKFFWRTNTVLTTNAAHLTPAVGDTKGTPNKTLLFFSRRGQAYGIDIFDSETNYNCFIAAKSGSGKSFLANYIILSYIAEGGKVWVIDRGGSYVKLADNLDGRYIGFKPHEKVILNPFTRLEEMTDDDRKFLVKLFMAMVLKEDEPALPLEYEQNMENAIMKAYRQKENKATITDVYDSLMKAYEEALYKDLPYEADINYRLAKRLYRWTRHGPYGKYFEGDANVDFDKEFIGMDLDPLSSDPDLQNIILLMLVHSINHYIMNMPRGQRKLLIIDEAWALLKNEHSADVIEFAYRTYRKFGGSIIIITQSITDLWKMGSVGRVVVENSEWNFILSQNPEVLDAIYNEGLLSIDGRMLEILKTVKTRKGYYSEIFIKSPYGRDLVRFIASPVIYWIATTNPDDLQAIQKMERAGYSRLEAIRYLAEHYPSGIGGRRFEVPEKKGVEV